MEKDIVRVVLAHAHVLFCVAVPHCYLACHCQAANDLTRERVMEMIRNLEAAHNRHLERMVEAQRLLLTAEECTQLMAEMGFDNAVS